MSKSTRPAAEVNGRASAVPARPAQSPLNVGTVLTAALFYDGMGWVPVPLCHPEHRGSHPPSHAKTCTRPGKQPTRKLAPLKEKSFTTQELQTIWQRNPSLNVGVLTGRRSQIIMVDCDSQEALEAYESLVGVHQAASWRFRGGRPWPHFVYSWPYDWAPKSAALKEVHAELDFLGEGSLSVMPPSLHKSGVRYEWTHGGPATDVPLSEPPAVLLEMLRTGHYENRLRGGVVVEPAPRLDARELTRPAAYAEQCEAAVSGAGGRAQTFKVACKMVHGFGLSVHDAHRVLLAHWNGRCVPPWTDEELLKEIEGARERGHAPRIEERHFVRTAAGQVVAPVAAPAEVLPGRKASSLKHRELGFILNPYVARSTLTLLVGGSNSGKSTFLAHLVKHARSTVYLPGYEEDPDLSLLPRLLANHVRLDDVHLLDRGNWKMPVARDKLLKIVQQLRADLVVVDPVTSYIAEGGSENSPENVRELLEAFLYIAVETDCAVVVVRHPGKDPNNLLRGAGSWREVPRVILELLLEKGECERRLIRFEKDGYGRGIPPSAYKLNGEKGRAKVFALAEAVTEARADLMRDVPDQLERLKIDQAVELLKSLLHDGRKDAKTIFAAGDLERLSERTMRNAARQLGIKPIREGFGTDMKSYWALPGG